MSMKSGSQGLVQKVVVLNSYIDNRPWKMESDFRVNFLFFQKSLIYLNGKSQYFICLIRYTICILRVSAFKIRLLN